MKTLFSFNALLLLAFASQADPTRPAPGYIDVVSSNDMAASTASTMSLQLIHNGSQGRTATINGHFLKPGDQYQGYTLTDISTNAVVLSRGDEQRILQLHNKTIKNYDK
ncbi:hypothetical protein [Arsukibacterium indicum]|uniref:MSHA biogenesis protein MshK n=1 Tax=Arsukibacterium indicum TaxID=2848612 RepID=A0ABS6MNQ3_9GAMM|nr:hypothetical protein [Arsukibacterium indicum]MBV2130452.1 hypothetical protein [Arsukibacterium indicum]